MNTQNPIEAIAHELETKSSSKQLTYRNLLHTFSILEKSAKKVIRKIDEEGNLKDKEITLHVRHSGEHEFQVKLAGDILIFLLHTNIVTLPPEHAVNKSAALSDDPQAKYFGQILVYNFMSDSIRYNRLNDPGYLVGRFFLNKDNNFFVEGQGQLSFTFKDLSEKPVSEIDLEIFVQLCLMRAIQSDLVAPPYPNLKPITLLQKKGHTAEMGMGKKIGFRMAYEEEVKS